MSIFEHILSAARCLSASKMRTFLTTLGIIVGISSVILINTIGSTIGKTIDTTMSSLISGNELDITFYNYDTYSYGLGDSEEEVIEITDSICEGYGQRLVMSFIGDYEISPAYISEDDSDDAKKSATVSIISGSVSTKSAYAQEMVEGRYISDEDVEKCTPTAVISEVAAEKIFGKGVSAVGRKIDVKNFVSYTVVGVYKDKISEVNSLLSGEDELTNMIVNYSYTDKLFDVTTSDIIIYLLNSDADTDEIQKQVKEQLEPYAEEGYTVYTSVMSDQLKIINSVIGVITKIIAGIAAISLLVGGIGVMNIMLVSVTERTMEIGVRKAMGADNKSIRIQFITESVMISLIGSVIGIVLGLVNAKLLAIVAVKITDNLNMPISIDLGVPVGAIVYSVIFSFAVGLIFGVYPANKAAKMQVVDALRYE